MYAPLALLFPCAVPTALPTIFYLEHGHEHVPAEAHGSLRGAKVEKVAAVIHAGNVEVTPCARSTLNGARGGRRSLARDRNPKPGR